MLAAITLALFAVLLGAAFCFAGYRFFLVMLPIWGFFGGFWIGATVGIFGAGLLGAVVGRTLGDRLPERAIAIGAAVLFAVFGVVLLLSAR